MPEPTAPKVRVSSVDILRGIVIVLMTLDHVRDFLGSQAIQPTDVAHASPALFLTRWITHFCAPTFFLLMGTGAFFSGKRRTKAGLSRFLITRGLWLALLELTVFRCLGYQFNADYKVTLLVILWALGWSLVALGLVVWLSPQVIGALGLVIIACHNLFDGIGPAQVGSWAPVWNILHQPGFVAGPPHVVFVAYPLVPWIGVTAVGYALGVVFDWEADRRRSFLLRAGLAATVLFLVLRGINHYGDPAPWKHQASGLITILSFLNTTKYPPSLLFLLMTLGPALLALRALDGGFPRVLRPALTYGRVPLFYFLLHIPLIHLVAVGVSAVSYGGVHWMFESPDLGNYPFTQPPHWGIPLAGVYLAWVLVVAALYPLCAWYGRVKHQRRSAWLSYL